MFKLKTDKKNYLPGETISLEVKTNFKKPQKARRIEVTLYCIEKKKVQTKRIMDHYDYHSDKELGVPRSTHIETVTTESKGEVFRKVIELSGEKEYTSETFTGKIYIPRNANPTSYHLGHDNKAHIWKLKAKLDIPFRLDRNQEKEIHVRGLSH